jgi:hypothetical protein
MKVCSYSLQFRVTSSDSIIQNVAQVLDSRHDLQSVFTPLFTLIINRIQGSTHALTNLSNLINELLSMRENDKNILVDGRVSLGINNRIGNFSVIHVEIAAKGTEQDAFKNSNLGTRNDASDKTNVNITTWAIKMGTIKV